MLKYRKKIQRSNIKLRDKLIQTSSTIVCWIRIRYQWIWPITNLHSCNTV